MKISRVNIRRSSPMSCIRMLRGAEYMSIADQLEEHAHEELKHALIISRQIDYLGAMPTVMAKQVRTSEDPREMLRFDLNYENETIKNDSHCRNALSRHVPARWV